MAASDKAGPGKYDRLNAALEKLSKPTAFELGVVRALHDIHRRVIEEPWYGRTIHDVVSHYNQRLGREYEQEKEREPDPTQNQEQKKGAEQEVQHDYSPDTFFGRDKASMERQQERNQQEQQHAREQGRERGRDIER